MRNTVQILQKGQKVSEYTQVKTPSKHEIFSRILASNWVTYQQFMRLFIQGSLEKCQLRVRKDLKLLHVAPLSGKIVEDSFSLGSMVLL